MIRAVVVVLLAMIGLAHADPRADLASPDPAKRDAAAATLRKTYAPPPRAPWDALVASIAKGDPRAEAEAKIGVHETGFGASGGGSTSMSYLLDDRWQLTVWYDDRTPPYRVIARELVEDYRRVWVEPPAKFTGAWVTYFANGQVNLRLAYRDGKPDGEQVTYYWNGQRAVVATVRATGSEGDEVGYSRAGKVAYRGSYLHGKQVGVWTWYDDAGKVTSTKKY